MWLFQDVENDNCFPSYDKAALSQIDGSDNFFYFFCLGMRQFLRKCVVTNDIRLLTKDQVAVVHIYVRN